MTQERYEGERVLRRNDAKRMTRWAGSSGDVQQLGGEMSRWDGEPRWVEGKKKMGIRWERLDLIN
jgi:hypothetical protein